MRISIRQLKQVIKEQVEEARLTPAQKRRAAAEAEDSDRRKARDEQLASRDRLVDDVVKNLEFLLKGAEKDLSNKSHGGGSTSTEKSAVDDLNKALDLVDNIELFQRSQPSERVNSRNEREYDILPRRSR
jgi:hypothetical protein